MCYDVIIVKLKTRFIQIPAPMEHTGALIWTSVSTVRLATCQTLISLIVSHALCTKSVPLETTSASIVTREKWLVLMIKLNAVGLRLVL